MLTHLAPAPPLGPRLCLALSSILRKSACPCSGPRIRSRARALRPGSGTGQKQAHASAQPTVKRKETDACDLSFRTSGLTAAQRAGPWGVSTFWGRRQKPADSYLRPIRVG